MEPPSAHTGHHSRPKRTTPSPYNPGRVPAALGAYIWPFRSALAMCVVPQVANVRSVVWEAQIAQKAPQEAKMTRSDTKSDWVSEEWSNDPHPPVPVEFGVTPCHFRLLGGLLGNLCLPDPPKGPI